MKEIIIIILTILLIIMNITIFINTKTPTEIVKDYIKTLPNYGTCQEIK